MKNSKPYRPNVGIMLLNGDGDVFLAHRVDSRVKAWQMPQGGIDAGEDEYAAALRELFEETGVKSVRPIAESTQWYTYDFPAGIHFVSEKKKAYAGQTQKWFLLQFTGEESEIQVDRKHAEFNAWKWARIEDVVAAVVDFKRDVYRQVVNEFTPFVDAVREDAKKKQTSA